MDINYFKSTRILDGGMGQELLARGLISKGTLWSASALLDKKYHQLVIDTHLSFINAGADVIVTNTFTTRRIRMQQNQVNHLFNFANEKAGELALKAKEISKKNILIAGGLPAQSNTYQADKREKNIIEKDFYDQATLINPYIDFFYLDVISSGKELEIALNIIEKLNKPVLVGIHIKKNGKLPSGETITEIVERYKNNNWLGLIAACVSLEIIELTCNEIKKLNLPFGFKANLWSVEEPIPSSVYNKAKFNEIGKNPNISMGKREDVNGKVFYEFAKKIMKIILIMGLPGAGKTTLANELAKLIKAKRLNADEIRKAANDWDFSEEGRTRQAKRMFDEALKLKSEGNNVIADFICPTSKARILFPADYIIWVDTIEEGRFDDTNKMFVKPDKYDFHVTTQDAKNWAPKIYKEIK